MILSLVNSNCGFFLLRPDQFIKYFRFFSHTILDFWWIYDFTSLQINCPTTQYNDVSTRKVELKISESFSKSNMHIVTRWFTNIIYNYQHKKVNVCFTGSRKNTHHLHGDTEWHDLSVVYKLTENDLSKTILLWKFIQMLEI